jgi:BirA family biotin operon repressor/biotin-[acetyl-CoA-carboxylase] ligase
VASLAIANMLQQFVYLPAEIKWPNDIIIRGRKAAGVLVEARSNQPDTYVLGIGLNVNQLRGDFPEELRTTATSLRLERPGAAPLNRVRVLRPLLFYLEKVYELLRKKKWEKLARAWAEFVPMGGKRVSLQHSGSEHRGVVQKVDPARGITLKLENGESREFSAEGVSLVREISDDTATA